MKTARLTSIILITVLLATSAGLNTVAYAADVNGQSISSLGAIVIDFETGMEIYAYNADVRRGPASMTKMMTVYLVYEAIANGLIDYDTIVPISAYVYDYSRTPGETNVPLNRNVEYNVSELLDVIVVMSAGGACAALAELIAGTTTAFFRLMNAKAEEWGIDAIFRSVSGGSVYTQMTPRAMATIARHMIMDYPEVLEKTCMESVTFHGRTLPSTNHLLGVYEGIDGLKTGTHPETRANFTGTARRGDIRIISVTMGSSSARRFPDTTILLDYGFSVMEAYWAAIEASKLDPEITPVLLNGTEIDLTSFFIENNRYFNIREVAYALDGTKAQFNVRRAGEQVVDDGGGDDGDIEGDDGSAGGGSLEGTGGFGDDEFDEILLTSGVSYIESGGRIPDGDVGRRLHKRLSSEVILDGEYVVLNGFDLEGDDFFQLNDIGDLLGFDVVWRLEGDTYRIHIDTHEEPPPEEIEVSPSPPPVVAPVRPTEPPESAPPVAGDVSGNEETQPVPLAIVFSVVGGLCVIGIIVALIKRKMVKR